MILAIDPSKHLYLYFLAFCLSPGGIAHGIKMGTDYRHGKTVWYQCDAEYTLKGNDRLTCYDGSWNLDLPECKGKYKYFIMKCNYPLSFRQKHISLIKY